MRSFILILALLATICSTTTAVPPAEVEVTVINYLPTALPKAWLEVTAADGTTEKHLLEKEGSVSILLKAKKGNTFTLLTAEPSARLLYDAKNFKKNRQIIIEFGELRLQHAFAVNSGWQLPFASVVDLSNAAIDKRIEQGDVNFVLFGLAPTAEAASAKFLNSFGVGFYTSNCMVGSQLYRLCYQHNKRLAAYLEDTYGAEWVSELPFELVGVALLED